MKTWVTGTWILWKLRIKLTFRHFFNIDIKRISIKIKKKRNCSWHMKRDFLTWVPLYMKPFSGLRSSGCCTWSESLSWQITFSLIGGPMLNDTQVVSIRHRFLQSLPIFGPKYRVMFLITWPCRAYPSIGFGNESRRQRPESNDNNTHQYQFNEIPNE